MNPTGERTVDPALLEWEEPHPQISIATCLTQAARLAPVAGGRSAPRGPLTQHTDGASKQRQSAEVRPVAPGPQLLGARVLPFRHPSWAAAARRAGRRHWRGPVDSSWGAGTWTSLSIGPAVIGAGGLVLIHGLRHRWPPTRHRLLGLLARAQRARRRSTSRKGSGPRRQQREGIRPARAAGQRHRYSLELSRLRFQSTDAVNWSQIATYPAAANNATGAGMAYGACPLLITEQVGGALGGSFVGISARSDTPVGPCEDPNALSIGGDRPIILDLVNVETVGNSGARTALAFGADPRVVPRRLLITEWFPRSWSCISTSRRAPRSISWGSPSRCGPGSTCCTASPRRTTMHLRPFSARSGAVSSWWSSKNSAPRARHLPEPSRTLSAAARCRGSR